MENSTTEILFTPAERAYLEPLAIQYAMAEKTYHAAVGALAVAKNAGAKWELKADRSGFTVAD